MAIDPLVLIFLSSGLFLGWALGANDAANVLELRWEQKWFHGGRPPLSVLSVSC